MFKKCLSVLLCICILCSTGVFVSFAKTSTDVDTHLQFGSDGKFRIMQVTDLQDGAFMQAITKMELRKAITHCKPDLIVLTGDNISIGHAGKATAAKAIHEFMSIFEKYGVPVAMVFGNHDTEETAADKAFQIAEFEKYSCFVGCAGEDLNPRFLGNYYIPIYSSKDKNEMVSNVWMIDSGTYNEENPNYGGYACVSKEQIRWYQSTSEALEQQYGHPIPSLMFQHIIVPEIWSMVEYCPVGTPGSLQVYDTDNALLLPPGTKGQLNEVPCPPSFSNGQLAAIDARGDVMAMFFGHDHSNSFEIVRSGCDIINTPGAGFNASNSLEAGVRMIILDENHPDTYETELATYLSMFEGNPAALALFDVCSSTSDTPTILRGLLRCCFYFFTFRFIIK